MTLYRLRNTSSCSLCYELGCSEVKNWGKNGDREWKNLFDSRFKGHSEVLKALRDTNLMGSYPRMEEMDKYLVHVPNIETINYTLST